jgi:hypothetical protein
MTMENRSQREDTTMLSVASETNEAKNKTNLRVQDSWDGVMEVVQVQEQIPLDESKELASTTAGFVY